MKPRFSRLADWLTWLETLHPQEIDLGLSRVFEVAKRLQLFQSYSSDHSSGKLAISSCEVFTVAGTNGKGSCVKTIEQCLLSRDMTVGAYTSPHIHHYNERIQVNGVAASDEQLCAAFFAIDQARGDISLTYFEFGTLAALWIFKQQNVRSVVLEVGLGGRLDAVNIVDPDIAIITSIALDHEEWLGSDLNGIAQEKLGVTRADIPVVIAEASPLDSLIQFSEEHHSSYLVGRDFYLENTNGAQYAWTPHSDLSALLLPPCSLPMSSIVAGLQALFLRGYTFDQAELSQLLPDLQLEGRFQKTVVNGQSWIFDVAHNVAAVELLAQRLQESQAGYEKTLAVFAAMEDKDVEQMVALPEKQIDGWFIGGLPDNPRAMKLVELEKAFQRSHVNFKSFNSICAACDAVIATAMEHDRIVVFGSFVTVAAVQQHIAGFGYGETSGK